MLYFCYCSGRTSVSPDARSDPGSGGDEREYDGETHRQQGSFRDRKARNGEFLSGKRVL